MMKSAGRKALSILALAAFAGVAHANLFVYEGPNGQTLVSNMPMSKQGFKLRYERKSVEYVGYLAAGRKGPPKRVGPLLTAYGYNTGNSHYSNGSYAQISKFTTDAYDSYIREAAGRNGVDPALVKAVIHVESAFNPSAVSSAGARGLMQLMPDTAARYDIGMGDLFSPQRNIDAGVQHLAYLKTLFPNNIDFVLAAYNAGENNVVRYNGIPPFPETQDYVKKVKMAKLNYQTKMI